MSLNWANNNHNYVPAYQMSGIPFQTGSGPTEVDATPVQVKFPYVTRWIQVRNIGSNIMRLGFTENGVNAAEGKRHFIIIGPNQKTPMFEVKCTSVFIRANAQSDPTGFDVMAGYTTIPVSQIFVLTGSNDFEGVG